MPQTSFALLTNLGRAKEAAAIANATTIEITHIAIGDGATVPSGGETALYNQVALKTISGHGTVVGADNVAYFDCYLAAGDGPYTIREAGLYDVDGDLIAIAHYDPPFSKPVPESGQTVEGTIRIEVAFSNVANVIISIDSTIQVALQRLSRLPWIPVVSMSIATPPGSPTPGDAYVIAASPTGSWTGQAGKIAEYTVAGWAIITPPDGHGVSLPDGRVFERVSGTYVEKIALDAQSGKWVYAADSGTADALVVTLAPVPVAYTTGMSLLVKAANANTGPATLNVNGLGAKNILRSDGTALLSGDLAAGSMVNLAYNGTAFVVTGLYQTPRPRFLAATTYYVNSATGSDTLNNGITALTPFATIQKALDVMSTFDNNGFDVTVACATGSYAGAVLPRITGSGLVYITGDTSNPANVNSTAEFKASGTNGTYWISGFKITSSGNAASADLSGTVLYLANLEFGACTGPAHIVAQRGASIIIAGTAQGVSSPSWKISGSCPSHFLTLDGGNIAVYPQPIVLTGTPAFSSAFARSGRVSSISSPTGTTWSSVTGSATGTRYSVTSNAVIDAAGAGATVYPGNAAGTTASGGQYL